MIGLAESCKKETNLETDVILNTTIVQCKSELY